MRLAELRRAALLSGLLTALPTSQCTICRAFANSRFATYVSMRLAEFILLHGPAAAVVRACNCLGVRVCEPTIYLLSIADSVRGTARRTAQTPRVLIVVAPFRLYRPG